LFAYTVKFPDTAFAEKLTVMLLVPAPDAMVAPDGRVHMYVRAFEIGSTEYAIACVPAQTIEVPVIAPAAPGLDNTVTLS